MTGVFAAIVFAVWEYSQAPEACDVEAVERAAIAELGGIGQLVCGHVRRSGHGFVLPHGGAAISGTV